MGTPVTLREITKSYPGPSGSGKNTVVDRVSLEIADGEIFFLLGPSGCGKTTLLRMIAGFIEPDEGSVLFGSREVTYEPPQRRNTGMVFQSYATWPHMTVRGNVAFGLETRKLPSAEIAARANEALAMVQMEQLAGRKPAQLSGGQQQRVALARAIAVRPEVLLLDEPLSNLDAKLRVELRSEIRRVCKAAGTTSIYVTHDQREAMSIADRIAVMRAGRVEQVGTPIELYRRPVSAFCAEFMGDTNLVEGEVASTDGNVVTLSTPIGQIRGVASAAVTGKAKASFRPESVRIELGGVAGRGGSGEGGGRGGGGGGGGSTWNTTVPITGLGEPTLLGEVWHQVAQVGPVGVKVTDLGTPAIRRTSVPAGSVAMFSVDDTTILPA